jgi:hypothetical protein
VTSSARASLVGTALPCYSTRCSISGAILKNALRSGSL